VTDKATKRFAVDRREGSVFVLVGDAGEKFDVPAAELPKPCRSEGAVLDVPMEGATPRWKGARRNHAEEKGRLREAGDRIARLKRRDPGGDVSL
jgi:hypothetical protein